MAQFNGKATKYLDYGSVKIFPPPKGDPCGTQHNFCQPTQQNDDIAFQFLAAETLDLVASGTFPDGSHQSTCGIQDWCGNGWSVSGNKATHITGTNIPLRQQSLHTLNDYFRLSFTISDLDPAGGKNLSPQIPGGIILTENGDYEFYYIWTIASTNDLFFLPSPTFDGSISNVKLVEVAKPTDYDVDIYDIEGSKIDDVPAANVTANDENVITVDYNWTDDVTVPDGCVEIRIFLDTELFNDDFTTDLGWKFSSDAVVIAGNAMVYVFLALLRDTAALSNIDIEVGVEYTTSFDIVNYVSGQTRIKLGTARGDFQTGNGTYTQNIICTDTTLLSFDLFTIAGAGSFDIDNIVIEKVNTFDGQSECFDLQDFHDCTLLWVWSNNESWGGYDYSDGFEHKLRIASKFRGTKYPSERNIGEDSGGEKSLDYYNLRKTKLIDVKFNPEYIHDAIAAFFSHDNREIGGTSFIMDDEYEPSPPHEGQGRFKDLMTSRSEIQPTLQPNQINRNE